MSASASDIPKLFLQAIISRNSISDKLAKVLCRKSIEAVKSVNNSIDIVYDLAFFETLVVQINESLQRLRLEFRSIINEDNGERTWALVDTEEDEDEISQMATRYSSDEIAYFRELVDQIMLAPSECYSIASFAALQLVNDLPIESDMTQSKAQIVLESFVTNHWLSKSTRGRYSLSSRSIMELQPYLKAEYADEILECTICMEIITKGVSCYVTNCKARLHFHCYKRYRTPKCPICSAEWTSDRLNKIGEGAVLDQDIR